MTESLRPTDELESLIQKKEPRLPKGTRTYIRRLKQAGKLDEALRVAEQYRQEKIARIFKVEDRLNLAVGKILTSKDDLEVATEAAMIVWLREKKEEITPEERQASLEEIYNRNPDLELQLAQVMPEVRDKAMRLNLN